MNVFSGAVRLRRSSDSAERDFPSLDDAEIDGWLGGAEGSVVIIYGLDGQAFVQDDPTKQPAVVRGERAIRLKPW